MWPTTAGTQATTRHADRPELFLVVQSIARWFMFAGQHTRHCPSAGSSQKRSTTRHLPTSKPKSLSVDSKHPRGNSHRRFVLWHLSCAERHDGHRAEKQAPSFFSNSRKSSLPTFGCLWQYRALPGQSAAIIQSEYQTPV